MDILSIIVGAVISLVFSELYRTLNKEGKRNLTKRKINKLTKNFADTDILATSKGFPFYEYSQIETRIQNKKLIFCLPSKLKSKLSPKLLEGFQRKKESYLGYSSLDELGENLNITDFKSLVNEAKVIISQNFINRENGEYFNGNMFGIIKSDDYSRTTDNKESKLLHIDFFSTDYFTHKVMKHIYSELKLKESLKNLTLNDLNKLYYPFRTSLGISLVVEIPLTNQIILVKRSVNAAYSEGKEWIYISVTEALTDTDYDPYTSSINIQSWVQRGLLEELGLTNQYDISSLRIYDMFFEKNFSQDGLTASIKLKDNISFEDIKSLSGKDSELEISEKFVISINHIESFIKENKEIMREQTMFALKGFLSRH